jgi:hypothetical protein
MKLILKTSSTCEDYSGGCDYALVHLTPELAGVCLKRIGKLRRERLKDRDLYEKYYFDYSPIFFGATEEAGGVGDPLEERIENGSLGTVHDEGVWVVETEFSVADKFLAWTECNQMIVRENEVLWFTYPKHTDIQITTYAVPIELLERARPTCCCGGKR